MKKIYMFICLLIIIIPSKLKSLETPILEGNILYANGQNIVVNNRNDNKLGALISWNTGKILVSENIIIFGGGKEKKQYNNSQITVLGGNIDKIYGGGNGTIKNSSNVINSYINIDGGKINKIYAGGRLSSVVNSSNIKITNGIINNILGGGEASTESEQVGTYKTLNKSPNHVINSNITISGGQINNSVYGGGNGFSLIDRTSIYINNDNKMPYLIGSGINGKVKQVHINLTNSNIDTLQGLNNGLIDNLFININGSTINNLYILGNNSDKSVLGKINEEAYLNIIDGKINNLQIGSNNGENIKNNQKIYLTYMNNTIKNINEIKTQFKNISLIEQSSDLDEVPQTGVNNHNLFQYIIAIFVLGSFIKISLIKK